MSNSSITELLDKCEIYTTNVDDAEKYLHRLSKFYNENGIDILKTVMSVMQRYQSEHRVQLRGMVCLKKFFKQNTIDDLDNDSLKELMDILAIVIQSYSDDDYMIYNALLILYKRRISNDADFDRCRCLKAVIDYFVTSCNPKLDKVALSICFALSYEVEMKELSFNFPPQYQAKLLSMIRPRIQSKPIDEATVIALGALAQLTSENLSACEMLIKEGDVDMFIEMLDVFHGKSIMEAKLLAILYNVLEEVKDLRQQLIQQPLFISKISELVDSKYLSVSYEAAGVMAYLLVEMPTSPELQDQLHRVINNWQLPRTKGLAVYSSFKPLYSLLQCTDVHPVQLYAAWCIYQSCAYNPNFYCKMLEREDGLEILKKLEKDESTQPDVRNLCHKICDVYLANKLDKTI